MKTETAICAMILLITTACSGTGAEESNSPNDQSAPNGLLPITNVGAPPAEEDPGEGTEVICPVDTPLPVEGAGLRVVARSAERVVATYCGTEAGYTNEVALSSPKEQRIATGHITEVGTTVDLGVFTAGDELVFAIHVRTTGETFYSGPASRNSDGAIHAAVARLPDGTVRIGFEDLTAGGDGDFNDIVVGLTGDLDIK